MYYGSEFVNDKLIGYCLSHGIELTRSRPYRKNDPAWIEQKNGAVVRRLPGYRRFEGLAAARAMTRLYGASRLFVNLFQPAFKLAAKQRGGARVTKRYHPPQTSCASPGYLRSLQKVSAPAQVARPATALPLETPPVRDRKLPEQPGPVYAGRVHARVHALRMVWPIVCRRLESLPNINAMQLFEALCLQFPGRFTRKQYTTRLRRVHLWRKDARARGVVIGTKTYRRSRDKPRGRRPDPFRDHGAERVQRREEHPDQTALELLIEFQARTPGRYSMRQLYFIRCRKGCGVGGSRLSSG